MRAEKLQELLHKLKAENKYTKANKEYIKFMAEKEIRVISPISILITSKKQEV